MNNWKTGIVTDMEGLFDGAAEFLGARAGENFNLDTKNVRTMKSMFKGAVLFNTEFGDKFKTENVETMESMFENAVAFNKPINFNTPRLGIGAPTTAANNMFKMPGGGGAFNQPISKLDFRNLTAAPTTPFDNAAMNADATKKPVAGEKAHVKHGIVLVGKNIPFYFEGVAAGGSFAVGYLDKFYHPFDAPNKAFHNMTGAPPNPTIFASVNPPAAAVAGDEYQMVNYNNNRILAIEVRHTDTTDAPVSQPALDDANVYIYFSKPTPIK